jgi:hypothetical protein
MRLPTEWLTVREQIRAITHHTIACINEVPDRHTK